MPKARAVLKWLGIGLCGLLAVAAGSIGLGYAWLRSDGGGDWLARQIEQAASSPGEVELSIGSLEGDLPAQLSLRDIAVKDTDGPWLTIAAAELSWQPWELLSRTLLVDSLNLSGVDLARLPASTADAEGKEDSFGLPSLPLQVRLHQLAADEIALGEPVLGQAARFTLAGEATGHEDGRLAAGLELLRLDGVESEFRAQLEYDPASDLLTARINAAEAPGGLVAALLGQPDLPRTELHLNGSGPLSAWQGDFALSLGELASAAADIHLARDSAGELNFRLEGQGDVNLPPGEPAWDLLRGRTQVALAGSWREAQRLDLERFSADNANLSLETSGSFVPLSGAVDLTMDLKAQETALLAGLLDLDRLERVNATVAVTGTLEQPEATLLLQAEGIAVPDFEAAALSANGRVVAAGGLLGPSPELELDLSGQLEKAILVGADEFNAVLDDTLPWSLRGSLDLGSLVLDVDAVTVAGEGVQLSASGPFNLEDGSARLEARLDIAEMAGLQPLTSIALDGRLHLSGPIEMLRYGSRLQGELTGRWEQPQSEIALLTLASGTGLDFSTGLLVEGTLVQLRDLEARSKVAELSGELTVASAPVSLDGRYLLTLPDAAALSSELGGDFSGPAKVEGDISGPVEALNLSGKLNLRQLTVEEQPLRDLSGTYRLQLRGAEVDGPVTLALTSPFGPVTAQSDLQVRKTAVTLSALQAKLGETTLRGQATLPLDGAAPIAEFDGEIGNLTPWLDVAGLAGGGQGKVTVKLNAPGGAAPLLASADLSGVSILPEPGDTAIVAERLTFNLEGQDTALEQPASFRLRGQGVSREDLALDRLDLDGKGNLQDLDITLAASGNWVEPVELSAAVGVRQDGNVLSINLRKAEGQAFGQPLQLQQEAQLTLAPGETRLQNLDLSSGETRLTADARLGGEQLAVSAVLNALPMRTVDAIWQNSIDGTVSAKLDLEGTLAAPRGTASLTATALRAREAKNQPELELTAEAVWQDNRLKLDGQLGGADVASARFSVAGPLAVAADGSGLEVADDAPLSGQVNWAGNISTALLFVTLPQQRLNGKAEVTFDLGGTVGAPRVDGKIALNDGRYENFDSGTVLRDLVLAVDIAGDRASISRLSASDGAKGKLAGKGELLINAEKRFPLDFGIAFEKFRAVDRDDVTAIADGDIKIKGTVEALKIEGLVTTESVEVSLLTSLPPNVVSLDVIEVKDGEVQTPPNETKAAAPVEAALDIVIDMPGRVFVRGRGLESDWSGRFHVQGTTAEPEISGEVKLVRGRLSVVGKPFNLTEGRVTLPKGADPDPQLDVVAVHKGKDLLVEAEMSGSLSEPELRLRSIPDLPRDEIISRVLFGKSASALTAGEAAQLALALGDLTGGGGPDLLGFARRAIGVDVLRVGTSSEGGAAVEVGKYLTDDVFIGVTQGTTPNSGGAGVEIDLTPNITVESEVTDTGASKSGVRFQLDY